MAGFGKIQTCHMLKAVPTRRKLHKSVRSRNWRRLRPAARRLKLVPRAVPAFQGACPPRTLSVSPWPRHRFYQRNDLFGILPLRGVVVNGHIGTFPG